MASFVDITDRKRAKRAVKESKKQIRVLSSKLLEAEEKERKRIAQDLHDIIGSSLTAIKYGLEKHIDNVDEDRELEKASLDQLVAMVKDTIKETKRISRSLRPSILDNLGILATIKWACREFQEVYSDVRIEKSLEVREEEVLESLKTVIYKVLQEALNNVAKHSEATLVRLHLRKTEENLELSVEDNGRGFDLKEVLSKKNLGTGIGLASMKERAELYGGSFEVLASRGRGTIIRVSWPCS
jgi:signal transduction histidine kinase